MADTGVKIGHGTVVRIGRGATPTWTPLVGLEDVTFPNSQVDEHEVTHMQSGGTKEYIPGLQDNGEVSFTTHWVPGSDQDTLIQELKTLREIVQVEFTAANGGTPEAYAGFVKGYERVAPNNGPMKSTITFRISGRVE